MTKGNYNRKGEVGSDKGKGTDIGKGKGAGHIRKGACKGDGAGVVSNDECFVSGGKGH